MTASTQERDALIETLERHRGFLLQTAEGLSEEQARTPSTVSALTIASILKHVADTEESWMQFALEGEPDDTPDEGADAEWGDAEWVDERFVLTDAETLPVLRQRVLEVGERTSEILRTADLDLTHPLPQAPWFEPGTAWSVRRVALHMLVEISQHAGHADIIREAMDGQRTMG